MKIISISRSSSASSLLRKPSSTDILIYHWSQSECNHVFLEVYCRCFIVDYLNPIGAWHGPRASALAGPFAQHFLLFTLFETITRQHSCDIENQYLLLHKIIAYENTRLRRDQEVFGAADEMVKKTLQSSEYDQDDEKVVFENEAGRALLEEITESMNNLFRVTSKIKALENDVKSLRQHEKTLQVKLSLLTNQYREYLCIRERFLDTFKRDILKNKSDQNIKAGNSVAVHGGDAVTDAYLYRSGKRQDERIFVKIYGLTAAQVEQLCKYSGLYHTLVQQSYLIWVDEGGIFPSLSILNKYASAVVSGSVSTSLNDAFEEFISILESNLKQCPQADLKSPLGIAWDKFWKAANSWFFGGVVWPSG